MVFIKDISERKKAEDALKTSEEQPIVYAAELGRKVELRTEALNNPIAKREQEVLERTNAEARASLKNKSLLLQVKYEGKGIPKEDQKHSFDRFFRASNAGIRRAKV